MGAEAARQTDVDEPALVCEYVGGEPYEYYPLGEHVVSAPAVCRGRATFKYTRVEVTGILDLVASGWSIEEIVRDYKRPELSREAIEEALFLAGKALLAESPGWKANKG